MGPKKIGMMCLSIWLVYYGLSAFLPQILNAYILGGLAIATGILLWLDR
jgi:uncharacterized membrane protein (DUF485 family)